MDNILQPVLFDIKGNPAGKICTKCKAWKPLTRFASGPKYKHGVNSRCRACHNEALRKRYRSKHGLQGMRRAHLQNTYKISVAAYDALFAHQSGVCAICKKPSGETRSGKVKHLAVDHCHVTNKVRGLLCAKCNQGIGHMKDDVTILQSAINYLQAHPANELKLTDYVDAPPVKPEKEPLPRKPRKPRKSTKKIKAVPPPTPEEILINDYFAILDAASEFCKQG